MARRLKNSPIAKKIQSKVACYTRKSSESEDRQALSIPAQIAENNKLAERNGINLDDIVIYQESKSAKYPGREEFNRMVSDIKAGRVDTIICWELDRLARNPKDSGEISWLLIQGAIKQIITSSEIYYPTSSQFISNFKFTMATQYSLDLSKNVKRGNSAKLETGWWSSLAPFGYLNNPNKQEFDSKPIIKDPDRFDWARKMWDMMLSRQYSVPQIVEIAQKEWGLTTLKRKRCGGGLVDKNVVHRIFNNPFYYGYMIRGTNEGWGKHEPMITQDEFETVQAMLRRGGTHQRIGEVRYIKHKMLIRLTPL